MSAAGDAVLRRATQLVQHCERCQVLLRSVLDWVDHGIYDPVEDMHALRLPGGVVRSIQQLVRPAENPPA